MKYKYRFIALLLMLSVVLSVSGCNNSNTSDSVLQYLDYSTGFQEDGQYNTQMYTLNGQDTIGADPGVFYVSKEEDPEYGGYFYMYSTSMGWQDTIMEKDEYSNLDRMAFKCWRSTDLRNWDLCGAIGGYSLAVEKEDWAENGFWAPEVIRNPEDGKYYLYASAEYPISVEGEGLSDSDNGYDRFAPLVAVSDTPVGPFKILYNIDPESGDRVPVINFTTGCNIENAWGVIDFSPFFDDDGTLYLYFVKHIDDNYNDITGIWGMRMKSMTEPDYSSITYLTDGGYQSLTHTPGNITEDAVRGDEYYFEEHEVNEGPFMIKHNGKYYLTYSVHGYGEPTYQLHQAISDSPLSGFVKLDEGMGNPFLNGNQFEYMNGTGHHSFVKCEDELWVVYHRHDKLYDWVDRVICADRVSFVKNAEGVEVLSANGPSLCLQWKSEAMGGYANLAEDAAITVSNGADASLLNDSILPYYVQAENLKVSFDKDITITLTWDEPVNISSLMIYNSNQVDRAFSKISDIRIKTEEKQDGKTVYKVIKDLQFPEQYLDDETGVYTTCAPAVAEFETLMATEITITIKASDRLIDGTSGLDVSEIVVLGGKANE